MATLDKYTQFNCFDIWQPRYKDRMVLLAAHRVGLHNKVVFTKAPHLGTDPYYVSGSTVKKYKKESNGKIACYAVPLDELEPLTLTNTSLQEVF